MTNRTITMSYVLKDAVTSELLEQSSKPIKFVSGLGQIMPKLESEVLNLSDGEKKVIKILSKDAAGEYDSGAVQALPKEQFAGIDLREGMELFGQGENGQTVRVIVKAVGDEEVMVDFNHPFAGKDLEFDVEVLENRASFEEEVKSGMPEGVSHGCGCSNGDKSEGGCCGGGGHHHSDHECCGGGHHDDDHECCGGGGCGCH